MIEVGEYVRTKNGEIHKVIEVNEDPQDWNYYKYKNNMGDFEIYIVKHSKNIINLIEVGDYVNGYRVRCVYLEGKKHYIKLENFDLRVYDKEIKSIVTHEQFEAMKYKVEE